VTEYKMHTTPDGFLTRNDTEFMARVVELLMSKDPELDPRLEHTGGGVFCIHVRVAASQREVFWGTADGFWGGETHLPDGELDDHNHVFTSIPDDSQNVEAVAGEITRHAALLVTTA
jgi:hypothetical protein